MRDDPVKPYRAGEEIPFGTAVRIDHARRVWRSSINDMFGVAERPRSATRLLGENEPARTAYAVGEVVPIITDTDVPIMFPFLERHRFPSGRVHLVGENAMVRVKGGKIVE